MLFTTFITSGCKKDVGCPSDLQQKIFQDLDPPYEDLFDLVEEHILSILSKPWREMRNAEDQHYVEVK